MKTDDLVGWLNRSVLIDEPLKAVEARFLVKPGEPGLPFFSVAYQSRVGGDEMFVNLIAQDDARLSNCIAVPELIARSKEKWMEIVACLDWIGRDWQTPGRSLK